MANCDCSKWDIDPQMELFSFFLFSFYKRKTPFDSLLQVVILTEPMICLVLDMVLYKFLYIYSKGKSKVISKRA